jgi:quinol monooxygenase YgiN
MEIVRTKDTGTLQYEIYFNDDQSECIVLERYRDSEALIEHLANLGVKGTRTQIGSVTSSFFEFARPGPPRAATTGNPHCPTGQTPVS